MKKHTALVSILASAALLSGCSEQGAMLATGPANPSNGYTFHSAALASIVEKDQGKPFAHCLVNQYDGNPCGSFYDLRYAGPGAVYAYAAETGASSATAGEQKQAFSKNSQLFNLAGQGMGLAGPGAGIAGIFLAGASGHKETNPIPAAYNGMVKDFDAGRIFWIARYYPDEQNMDARLDSVAHEAITLAGDLQPAGWASGTSPKVSGGTYKIVSGFQDSQSETVLRWGWQGASGEASALPVLPVELAWFVQPWKSAKDPFYLVSSNPERPFMDLVTIRYRIEPGFSVNQWISAHQSNLSGWMVIYPMDGKTVVWKNGQKKTYPLPQEIVAKG